MQLKKEFGDQEFIGITPRALLVDLDMDMPGNVKRLFPNLNMDPDNMVSGIEDSASYAFRAHYTLGKEILD